MSQKRSVRACVAGLVFACAVAGTSSITTQADSVVIAIRVGSRPEGISINPAGTFAYVANYGSGTVSKINLATDTVTTITTERCPYGVAINPAGTFAYVTMCDGNVSKINLATDTVVASITVGTWPQAVAINPAGTFAYVTNHDSDDVSKIDLATDTVVSTIKVGLSPWTVAINPAGTFAYVTNNVSKTISKINLATDTVVASITVDEQPYGLAINPAGTFAYAASGQYGTWNFNKINLVTDTVVTRIKVGGSAYGVAINPAGTFAYVTNASFALSKINLATDTVASTIAVNTSGLFVAINPAGTLAYVTDITERSVSKIALVATDPQSLTLTDRANVGMAPIQYLGAKTFVLVATAQSNLPVAFSSVTPTVCTVSGSTVTMLMLGDCTINANQSGGSGWDAASQVSQTFKIWPSPPPGEAGVSIKNGESYSNTKKVALKLVWPLNATAVRISNDGGFEASKTQTKDLAASIDWELDDSVKGIYTKVVYVRFNGVADTTKTYSDDIILDTTAPVVESASAEAVLRSIDVSLKATDDITGVDKVEIQNGITTVTKDYDKKLSVTEKELGLTVSSSGVKKLASSSIKIRVSDKAGNWSAYQTLSVSGAVTTPAVTTPAVTTSKSATAKSIATFAKLTVLSTSKVSLKVVSSYAKYCKVSGTTLKGVKAGTCKVTVTVTPKKGRATSKTVTLRVTK